MSSELHTITTVSYGATHDAEQNETDTEQLLQSSYQSKSPGLENVINGKILSLEADARSAFKQGDASASKLYHASHAAHKSMHGIANELHLSKATNHYLKSLVYGGLDGIITTFATVTSVSGADFSPIVIVILGIAHLFADGLSMGMGDALSEQAEIDFNNSERKREKWEMEINMEGELDEMVALYEQKGVSRPDAMTILTTLAKYENVFLDHMMVEELGLMPVDPDDVPLKAGLVTMGSFILFGSVPLMPYLVCLLPWLSLSTSAQLWLAIVITMITLFILGAVKGMLVDYPWMSSGLVMVMNGSFAAAVAFVIGYILKQCFDGVVS